MTPQQELIKEIEKLDLWADRGRKEKIISTIKEFMKGYKLIKNRDIPTDKEIMCLAELMCFIKTKNVYPKGTGTKILKKLKRMRLEEIK